MADKSCNGLQILIVDDEVEFAETLALRLELRKFQVTVTHSGRDALEVIEKEPQDLMLLDLKIPDIGGIELAETLRSRGCTTKIIFVSGNGPAGEDEVKLEPPVVAYMAKPVELNVLLDTINALFAERN